MPLPRYEWKEIEAQCSIIGQKLRAGSEAQSLTGGGLFIAGNNWQPLLQALHAVLSGHSTRPLERRLKPVLGGLEILFAIA